MQLRFGPKVSRVRIAALCRAGASVAETVAAVGCGKTTVYLVRKALGIDGRLDKRAVRGLWADGLNDCQIARRLGKPRSTVQAARAKLRLPPVQRGRPKAGTAGGERCRA